MVLEMLWYGRAYFFPRFRATLIMKITTNPHRGSNLRRTEISDDSQIVIHSRQGVDLLWEVLVRH
jgi:hypothetical protein